MKKSSLKNLVKVIAPYKKSFISVAILSLFYVLSVLGLPLLFGEAVDNIIAKSNVDFAKIKKLIVIAVCLIVVAFVSQRIVNVINNKTTYKIVKDLRKQAFEKVQSLPLSYLDKTSSGEIISLIVSDADRVGEGLLLTFEQLFSGVLTIISIIAVMLVKEIASTGIPYITLLVLLLTPLSIFIAKFISKKSFNHFKARAEINAKQIAFINEQVTNEKVVKIFKQEENSLNKFKELNEKNRKASLKAIFFSSTVNPTTRFVYNVIYALICLLGGFLIINNLGLTVGGLFVYLSYANQYTKPFNEISSVLAELQNSLASIDRINNLISINEEKDGSICVGELSGEVKFNNVYFSYSKDKKIIENLSLKVNSGQKVAIVGPTGCGKTTLINLLVKFYSANSGEIKLDEFSIEDITKNSLRQNVGMVLQDCYIFTGTIKDNVKLGKPNATDEEVYNACKKSFADTFIERLPNGYETIVSENSGLSQGQKQLLSIARIMLLSPPIIILDEATSSIDFRTEKRIQEGIDALSQGRTVFTVAHRLATIVNADLILVMKDGDVVEQGTHVSLLEKGGFYASIYNSQFE